MKRIFILCLAAVSLFFFVSAAPAAGAARPNILLVLADDLGYGDLACFGSKIVKSPNLDRFATEGLRLTSCYAGNANCSPSRTALMTGRTPMRAGIRSAIPLDSPIHLRRGEVTIAGLLKQSGYSTAHVGKWHLNGKFNQPEHPQPGEHGFDYWFSTQNNALPNHHNPTNFVRNGKPAGKLEGFSGHLVADEAIRWLDAGRDKAKPFFLYTCFHEPHEPVATDEKYSRLYPSADPSYSAYYGNISQMDDAFGRLMRALDERGLRQNTLVWFTSDNGPAITPMHPHGSAGPLRDKKGSLWEGGIRVPGMVRWPGRIAPGKVSGEPVSGVDFLPTVCAIAGITPPPGRVLDGANVLPVFAGKPVARATPLYWHFVHASGEPKVALRQGDWKLLASFNTTGPRMLDIDERSEREVKTADLQKFFLHDLNRDLAEANELSAAEPAKLAELRALLEAKYREVRAETPVWPYWKHTNLDSQMIDWPPYYKRPGAQKKAGSQKK
ncbi:MAG: sulfatase-like hydrolase/transferase [Verrucomicrobia bacterium]|nr:sulfatase-like hydrolase/transferase [Verrucomicrobiota bacterium]